LNGDLFVVTSNGTCCFDFEFGKLKKIENEMILQMNATLEKILDEKCLFLPPVYNKFNLFS